MRRILYTLIFVGILIGASILFIPSYLSTSTNANVVEITVPEGASLNSVSNTLFDKGIIKSKTWFRYKAKAADVDRKIKPGTYSIPSNSTLDDIFTLLEKGIPDKPVVLTIPEGLTLYQIAEKVEELGFGTKDEFIEATQKYFDNNNYNLSNLVFFKYTGFILRNIEMTLNIHFPWQDALLAKIILPVGI